MADLRDRADTTYSEPTFGRRALYGAGLALTGLAIAIMLAGFFL